MTLTVLKTFVETDLADVPLQALLDAADEDMTANVGPDLADVQVVDAVGETYLFLSRPCSAIASIAETVDTVATTLATNDWKLWPSNMQLERLATGTHPAGGWQGQVAISFTPADLNRRNRALTQLVQLELEFRHGKKSESIGDHTMTQQDYDVARAKIFSGAGTWGFA